MEKKTIKIKQRQQIIEIIRGKKTIFEIKELSKLFNGLYIVTNDKVWDLWGYKIKKNLKNNFFLKILPDGERYKNIQSAAEIYNFLSKNKATRNSCLIALGGGVIGDLAGFCASTYHRGMKLIQIPTTLLSMVDSSIGGKTGFNLKAGKNLVGSFYQPNYIITDIEFISTLPNEEFLCGIAEIIKAGLISSKKLFELIEKNKREILNRDEKILEHIIFSAQDIKVKVVTKDEKETGLRAILNFGHTFGHSLEKISNWKLMHGVAVAQGMAFEAYLSYKKGYIDLKKLLRIITLLKEYGYDLSVRFSFDKIKKGFYYDKKRKDKQVEWVLLKDIGSASFGEKVEEDLLNDALKTYNQFLLSNLL